MSYIETPQEKLTEAIRAAVLAALDAVGETHDKPYKFKGWIDRDLPQLFKALDAHAEALYKRNVAWPTTEQLNAEAEALEAARGGA